MHLNFRTISDLYRIIFAECLNKCVRYILVTSMLSVLPYNIYNVIYVSRSIKYNNRCWYSEDDHISICVYVCILIGDLAY